MQPTPHPPETAGASRPDGVARLLADVGGTNARFAWQAHADAPIVDGRSLACAEHVSLAAAIQHYLGGLGRPPPAACAIAIANPVVGDRVTMTNHHWTFSIAALKAQFGITRLLVLNDFTALALALPTLPASELRQLGGRQAKPGTAIALIGPGTGLGVSGLLPSGLPDGPGAWVPLQGEGGHVTLAACTPREHAVLMHIGARYGHASAERAVCGQGLVDIHAALCAIERPSEPSLERSAADITSAALAGADPQCSEAVSLFCAFLGTTAGNLALTLGAQGGVYVGGGIAPRLGELIAQSPFRARFESKGRFASYLAEIPVFVIHALQSPALRGAARALDSAASFDRPA